MAVDIIIQYYDDDDIHVLYRPQVFDYASIIL